jgi:thioredoxin 1
MWIMVREINAADYEAEVVCSSVPVLLDIYGEHCPPCRQLAPTIDKLATLYEGRAKVLKVESGANSELAGGLAVSAVPTVVVFRDGKEVGRVVGLRPESAYRKLLEAAGVEG